MKPKRRPSGAPAGGRFDPESKQEPKVTLDEDAERLLEESSAEAGRPSVAAPPKTEDAKMARLAVTLAEMAEVLDLAASFVADGRPRIGSSLERRIACERIFEILGEQVKRLPDTYKAGHEEVDWSSMVGMRDRVSHGYGRDLNEEIMWRALSVSFPEVRRKLGL